MQQTGIWGILVNNRIPNNLRKTIATMCAKLKWIKKKSGGFGVKRLTDKWRDRTYSVKLFYYELDNYFIEKENQDLREEKRTPEESLKNEITKRQKLEEKLDDTGRSYRYHKKRFQGLVHRIAEMSKRGVMSPEKRPFNEHSK